MARMTAPPKGAVTKETAFAITTISDDLQKVYHEAQLTLVEAQGDTGHVAYRVRAGRAMGLRSALATLEAYLEIGERAKAILDRVDRDPLPLT